MTQRKQRSYVERLRPGPLRIAGAILFLGCFWYFHAPAIRAHFGWDEMMNLYGYWHPPLWKVVVANFAFWSKFVRPMAAIYYLPLYYLFGLNPVPFTLLRIALIFLNCILFGWLARYLLRSWKIAFLAAFPIAYHANLGYLAYNGAFIYDILCAGFYFAAFLYYVRLRANATALGARQIAVFLALYICALDSKEMAVSLPVMVLAYELLFKGRRAQIVPALTGGAITVIYILGKTIGPGSLTVLEAYHPVFTWARFASANTLALNTLLYTDVFTIGRVLELWGLLLYVGLRNWGRPNFDPRWLFLLIWVIVTPLPIDFLPGRGGAQLYLVLPGWAMLAAMTVLAVARRIARQPVAGLSRAATASFILLACIAAYVHETTRADRRLIDYFLTNGEQSQIARQKLVATGIRPSPGSRIAFLNDPFAGRLDMLFISALCWKDRTLDINLQQTYRLPADELAKMDYVFDYADGRFVVVKP